MSLLLCAIPVLILSLLFFWQSGRQRRAAGLPGGRIIYTDTRAWEEVSKPLYDAALDLTGKPDYIVQEGRQITPVEVKTGRTPSEPYDSHIFQLAAYCLLVDRTLRIRPKMGVLSYPNRTFAVDYTAELEAALMDLLAEMRIQERRDEIERSHDDPARCARCGYRQVCDQRLS
ncbi:MAG TPA: CRISPR-associated protein Cas4 [Anaerolineaceae bacterium]|nr:CRISPR-associated protein Cas4 [Anaerolineaceae bacterium]HPN52065.1 CRISPR-associated protein Cas4 [Anaerolineaceae bacterium]